MAPFTSDDDAIDEFERLRASCALHGSRSISEFARTSVLERMESTPNVQFGGPSRMFHLDHKVSELEHRFTQLLQILQSGPLAPHPLATAARTAAIGD